MWSKWAWKKDLIGSKGAKNVGQSGRSSLPPSRMGVPPPPIKCQSEDKPPVFTYYSLPSIHTTPVLLVIFILRFCIIKSRYTRCIDTFVMIQLIIYQIERIDSCNLLHIHIKITFLPVRTQKQILKIMFCNILPLYCQYCPTNTS